MHSEFYDVELDRIRYSLVWEDSSTLYNALNIGPEDHLLIVTSAGCNVLNALLSNPASITAIDLNPIQNRLLEFKMHVILNHDFESFSNIMGFNGPGGVADAWKIIGAGLDKDLKDFWNPFFQEHTDGILTSGKLENYITAFYQTLSPEIQAHLQKLVRFDDVKKQEEYFLQNLHNSSFKTSFIAYFDDENLSKGRDARLFKHAKQRGGEIFYKRLWAQCSSILLSQNFFFQFFFFGPKGLPKNILPPCYREEYFEQLRKALKKVDIQQAEAVDFLNSESGKRINKASLSNIFEYTTNEEFDKVYRNLFLSRQSSLKILFWNLLNQQGNFSKHRNINTYLGHKASSAKDRCFYFRNICTIETDYKIIKDV